MMNGLLALMCCGAILGGIIGVYTESMKNMIASTTVEVFNEDYNINAVAGGFAHDIEFDAGLFQKRSVAEVTVKINYDELPGDWVVAIRNR
jgi:hypothetical protein